MTPNNFKWMYRLVKYIGNIRTANGDSNHFRDGFSGELLRSLFIVQAEILKLVLFDLNFKNMKIYHVLYLFEKLGPEFSFLTDMTFRFLTIRMKIFWKLKATFPTGRLQFKSNWKEFGFLDYEKKFVDRYLSVTVQTSHRDELFYIV